MTTTPHVGPFKGVAALKWATGAEFDVNPRTARIELHVRKQQLPMDTGMAYDWVATATSTNPGVMDARFARLHVDVGDGIDRRVELFDGESLTQEDNVVHMRLRLLSDWDVPVEVPAAEDAEGE